MIVGNIKEVTVEKAISAAVAGHEVYVAAVEDFMKYTVEELKQMKEQGAKFLLEELPYPEPPRPRCSSRCGSRCS